MSRDVEDGLKHLVVASAGRTCANFARMTPRFALSALLDRSACVGDGVLRDDDAVDRRSAVEVLTDVTLVRGA